VIVFGRRRRKPPAKLRPALERNERVLAWAPTAAAELPGAVVVTNLGLWLPGRAARLGWHQVHKATWSGSNLTVVPSVRIADGIGSDGSPFTVMGDDASVVVSLSDPDEVPAIVRKRVTKSVAFTAHFPLPSGGVRVVARRVAGVNGLTWHVRYDDGTDPADPEVQAVTAAMVAEAAQPLRPE
jgi:hypothetical protein